MILNCEIANPPPYSDDWKTRWEGPDQGIICAWLKGIEKASLDSGLAEKTKRGELPITPFKGGVEKTIKSKTKIGSLHYIAYWQGLRGEDLHVDTEIEPRMTCTRTGVVVTFTGNTSRLLLAEEE